MTRHLTIITGGSRGLGRAMAEQRQREDHDLLLIARQAASLAPTGAARLESWQVDLADATPTAFRLAQWLSMLEGRLPASVTLINNAGVVSELAPLADVSGPDLVNALRVGLEAPMLLTSAFLRTTRAWAVPKKVLLISSGLGRRAMAGSASYCAAKAGMDHLARALSLEESTGDRGAKVVSLAPGVIDTDMQVQLRTADPTRFPERERFAGLKSGGHLDSPAQAAAKVLAYLDRADFGANPVADVRDA